MTESTRYYGKYRGIVSSNDDPEQRGRLQVKVPDVLPGGTESTWAEACVPVTGAAGTAMGVYVVPPVDAAVWVEFEHGDPNLPIWVGCRFADSSDVPSGPPPSPPSASIVIQCSSQSFIKVSDSDPAPSGGIVLQVAGGPSITMNNTGITLSSGDGGTTISMTSGSIAFNTDALTVLP